MGGINFENVFHGNILAASTPAGHLIKKSRMLLSPGWKRIIILMNRRKNLSKLLSKFSHSDSITEMISIKKEILTELSNTHKEIIEMRNTIFSIFNMNTRNVYGMLSANSTVNDRDRYIRKLLYYHEAEKK